MYRPEFRILKRTREMVSLCLCLQNKYAYMCLCVKLKVFPCAYPRNSIHSYQFFNRFTPKKQVRSIKKNSPTVFILQTKTGKVLVAFWLFLYSNNK